MKECLAAEECYNLASAKHADDVDGRCGGIEVRLQNPIEMNCTNIFNVIIPNDAKPLLQDRLNLLNISYLTYIGGPRSSLSKFMGMIAQKLSDYLGH